MPDQSRLTKKRLFEDCFQKIVVWLQLKGNSVIYFSAKHLHNDQFPIFVLLKSVFMNGRRMVRKNSHIIYTSKIKDLLFLHLFMIPGQIQKVSVQYS